MSYYRFFPLRDDYYHGRHHGEGIVNNLIVNVQEEYRPHLHYPFFDRYYRRDRSRSRSRSRDRGEGSGGSGGSRS